jgi:hypothetical protein
LLCRHDWLRHDVEDRFLVCLTQPPRPNQGSTETLTSTNLSTQRPGGAIAPVRAVPHPRGQPQVERVGSVPEFRMRASWHRPCLLPPRIRLFSTIARLVAALSVHDKPGNLAQAIDARTERHNLCAVDHESVADEVRTGRSSGRACFDRPLDVSGPIQLSGSTTTGSRARVASSLDFDRRLA